MGQDQGRVFRRCGYRLPAGESNRNCPLLADPSHGSWYFSVELRQGAAGRRRRCRIGGYGSESAARRALSAVVATPAGRDEWTTGGWLDYWLRTRVNLRHETWRNYDSHIRLYLEPSLGSVPLAALSAAHIRSMLAMVTADLAAGRGPVPTSLFRIHATLRSALNAAVWEELITSNPARLVDLPQRRRPHPVVWTDSRVRAWQETGARPALAVWTARQTAAFLQHLDADPLAPLFTVLALSGMRRGEALGLQWRDVDLDGATVSVCRQLQELEGALRVSPPKSAASTRELALAPRTADLLRTVLDAQRAAGLATDWVFCKPDGSPHSPSHISHRFHALVVSSRLPPVRLHDLRHGAATLALAAGTDLKTIQAMLGHASIVLTADTYTSVLPDIAREAARGIAQQILDAGRTPPGHHKGPLIAGAGPGPSKAPAKPALNRLRGLKLQVTRVRRQGLEPRTR